MDGWSAGRTTPTLLLIADGAAAVTAAMPAIEASGARLIATIELAQAAGSLQMAEADLLFVEVGGGDTALLDDALAVLADHAARGAAVIVSFAVAQLDQVAGAMLGLPVQLLCAADDADRTAAIALALAARRPRSLREDDAASEGARLQRLSDEVARITELLGRVGQGQASPGALADRSLSFTAEAGQALVDAADVRRAIRLRRLRDQYFGAGLFEDPAWDMLLDLFAAELERTRVSVSSLCIAAAVAPTTALRWIARMTEASLFVRTPDPDDGRRAFIMLSPAALASMHRYWQAMKQLASPSL